MWAQHEDRLMGDQNKPMENVSPKKAKRVEDFKGAPTWAERKTDQEALWWNGMKCITQNINGNHKPWEGKYFRLCGATFITVNISNVTQIRMKMTEG